MGAPPNITEETASLNKGFHGMDQRKSTPPNRKNYAKRGTKVPGILELLRGGRKHEEPKQVELGVHETVVQMVESAIPETQLYLGRLQRNVYAFWNPSATHNGDGQSTAGIQLEGQCKVSETEEPSARKPHAGICAGSARQRAFLPR